MDFVAELLQSDYKRSGFSCGEKNLDAFIQRQASQHLKSRAAGIFVVLEDQKVVKGYYTLSGDNVPYDEIPDEMRKKMPRYQSLPTTLLGRLAIDRKYQGQGLGELLLMDALYRSYTLSEQIGSVAVVVDALHEKAAIFYEKYGFIKLPDRGRLFMPMKTIAQGFKGF